MATEVTFTAGWLISWTLGTIATQASTAAMITTMEMTMLSRLPTPRRAAGCCTDEDATVSGALVVLTLPILADCGRYSEPSQRLNGHDAPVPPIASIRSEERRVG